MVGHITGSGRCVSVKFIPCNGIKMEKNIWVVVEKFLNLHVCIRQRDRREMPAVHRLWSKVSSVQCSSSERRTRESEKRWTLNVSRAYKTTCRINSVNVRDRHYLTSALLTRAAFSALSFTRFHWCFFSLSPVRCSLELSFRVELPFTELNKMQTH